MAELGGPRVYSCYNCRNQVCLHDDIISKAFQFEDFMEFEVRVCPTSVILLLGKKWSSILLFPCYDVEVGPKEDRQLMTGLHTVADINCADCRLVLGWKYLRAYELSHRYKEGRFIFEKSKIVKED